MQKICLYQRHYLCIGTEMQKAWLYLRYSTATFHRVRWIHQMYFSEITLNKIKALLFWLLKDTPIFKFKTTSQHMSNDIHLCDSNHCHLEDTKTHRLWNYFQILPNINSNNTTMYWKSNFWPLNYDLVYWAKTWSTLKRLRLLFPWSKLKCFQNSCIKKGHDADKNFNMGKYMDKRLITVQIFNLNILCKM